MDPTTVFCPNLGCARYGAMNEGHIKIHSQQERRYRCDACDRTFVETKGTPFYRLRTGADMVTMVVTLIQNGCPTHAIVRACGFDERTIATWVERVGRHCQHVHEHHMTTRPVDLGHVQADELYAKLIGLKVWLAMAIAVPSRLWLGAVFSPSRDLNLIAALVAMVRLWAANLAILVCVDGLSSYVTAFVAAFRQPLKTGQVGRPKLALPAGFLMGQVIKRHSGRRLIEVVKKAVVGSLDAITERIQALKTGTVLNTAYIERLNATFRTALAPLVRRSRTILRQPERFQALVYLVGTAYNFCWPHDSLRETARSPHRRVIWRTPAMAAGLTDHIWTPRELFSFHVPPAKPITRKARRTKPAHTNAPLRLAS